MVVNIVCSALDSTLEYESVTWAFKHLKEALTARGFSVNEADAAGSVNIWAALAEDAASHQTARNAGIELPAEAEAFALVKGTGTDSVRIDAIGADARGLVDE